MQTVGFIPARGGSRRIPRKNLRAVQGVPLVVRSVRTLFAGGCERVIVSTDDAEIAAVARLAGAEIDVRPSGLAGPETRIDEVIWDWLERNRNDWPPDDPSVVVVAQPTSPLLSPPTVVAAIERCRSAGDTVISVIPERHLLWSADSVPMNRKRVNSDAGAEPEFYRETGGVVAFQPSRCVVPVWPPGYVTTMVVDEIEGIDIDDYADLTRARAGARPAEIQIRYIEGTEVGAGHRYRAEALAVELSDRHAIEVVRTDQAQLGPVPPDVVILDTLDTTADEIRRLRAAGVKVIFSLEDRGEGANYTSATINELYGPMIPDEQDYFHGPRWAVLRPEFQGHQVRVRRLEKPFSVVVSFGGTDPEDCTAEVAEILATMPEIGVLRVIVPPRRPDFQLDLNALVPAKSPQIVQVVSQPIMAREFLAADLAVTSAGRTVHEAAACGVPVVAVATNARERAHDVCPGVVYLPSLSPPNLRATVARLLADPVERQERATEAHAAVDGLGAQRIGWLLDGFLGGMLG